MDRQPNNPRERYFTRYSASPSTTPTPTLTNGSSSLFGSPGSSPNNTVSRTIPTTIQINRPFNSNNVINNNNNPAVTTANSSTVAVPKRPTNTSLSALGIGTVNTTTPGEVQSNLKELKRAMTDIDNLSTSSATSSQFMSSSSSMTESTRNFRSSAKQLNLNSAAPNYMKRIDTSPAVMMISEPQSNSTSPSIQYGTGEAVDVDEVQELDGTYSNGSGPTPIITSPDIDFSDSETNGLTSPNLVSSMNPPVLSR
jgi:hypothetical protein